MINFETVKLVIWDLDGTIIDSSEVFASCVKQVACSNGYAEPSDETIRHNYHGKLDVSIAGVLGIADLDEAQPLVSEFLLLQEAYYKEPSEHLFGDAYGLAERLQARAITQIVVTNRAHEGRGTASPVYLIDHTAMTRCIDQVVSGDDGQYSKPDARVIDGVIAAHDLHGEQIVVIGDQFVDAQLAANLGAQCILINRGNQPVVHLDKLGDDIGHITQVSSLDEIKVY